MRRVIVYNNFAHNMVVMHVVEECEDQEGVKRRYVQIRHHASVEDPYSFHYYWKPVEEGCELPPTIMMDASVAADLYLELKKMFEHNLPGTQKLDEIINQVLRSKEIVAAN